MTEFRLSLKPFNHQETATCTTYMYTARTDELKNTKLYCRLSADMQFNTSPDSILAGQFEQSERQNEMGEVFRYNLRF